MILCIPTKTNDGRNAAIHEHFGSAPYFTIVNTTNGAVEVVDNSNQHHSHGMCHPMTALAGKNIEAVVCRGMGSRAVQKLNESNIKAYMVSCSRVQELLDRGQENLQEITPENACNQHGCH